MVALELGDPQFVITLCASLGVASAMRIGHPEWLEEGTEHTELLCNQFSLFSSEVDKRDENITG